MDLFGNSSSYYSPLFSNYLQSYTQSSSLQYSNVCFPSTDLTSTAYPTSFTGRLASKKLYSEPIKIFLS